MRRPKKNAHTRTASQYGVTAFVTWLASETTESGIDGVMDTIDQEDKWLLPEGDFVGSWPIVPSSSGMEDIGKGCSREAPLRWCLVEEEPERPPLWRLCGLAIKTLVVVKSFQQKNYEALRWTGAHHGSQTEYPMPLAGFVSWGTMNKY